MKDLRQGIRFKQEWAYNYNFYYFNMEAKIQDLQANFDAILEQVGAESYVDWEGFTKSTGELTKQVDQLISSLTLFKEVQQKRFLTSMKKMKAADVPDLIKTVRAKKLPRQALKAIVAKFNIIDNKVVLNHSAESLKAESKVCFDEYVHLNNQITKNLEGSNTLLKEKIKKSGFIEEPVSVKELISTFNHHLSEVKIEEACKSVSVQIQPGTTDLINIQTYGQIVQNTFDVVKDQYIRLTLESREKQRNNISEPKNYVETLVQYLTNTEVLILEGQRAIVKKLGLTQQKVEESQVFLMEKGLAQTILLLQSGLRTSIKQAIKAQKPVDFQKTKQIIRFQIAMIKQKTPFFKIMLNSIQKTPSNFQILPLIIALTLNDFVFDRYGLEQQDFMKSMTDQVVMSNPEISGIFKEMEKAIIILMKDAGVINEDMAKVMELQSQHIQDQMSEMGLGSFPGGIFPGSSPNDLLQQQQKNQFQQMKKK